MDSQPSDVSVCDPEPLPDPADDAHFIKDLLSHGLLDWVMTDEQADRISRGMIRRAAAVGFEEVGEAVAGGPAQDKLAFVQALQGEVNADPVDGSEPGFWSTTFTTTYGNGQAHAVAAVLASLADHHPAEFVEAVRSLKAAGKLDAVMDVAAGRSDSMIATAEGAPSIPRSRFDPDPLIHILAGAARSGDGELKREMLAQGARQLGTVEHADELLQQLRFERRPEANRIAASLYLLLGVPAPKPEWTPAPDASPGQDAFDVFDGADETMHKLRRHKTAVSEAAAHYQIDPRAIALVVQLQAENDRNDGFLQPIGLGRGQGFGAVPEGAVLANHPHWSAAQSETARSDPEYAPALIAADMDFKARIFEAHGLDIRQDPVALAWAYTRSTPTVERYAHDAGQQLATSGQATLDFGADAFTIDEGQVEDFAGERPSPGVG